jgi:hypothetical protein
MKTLALSLCPQKEQENKNEYFSKIISGFLIISFPNPKFGRPQCRHYSLQEITKYDIRIVRDE